MKDNTHPINMVSTKIIKAIKEQYSFDDWAKLAYELLENPVVIIDPSFRRLSWYPKKMDYLEKTFWESMFEGDQYGYIIIENIEQKNWLHFYQSSTVQIVKSRDFKSGQDIESMLRGVNSKNKWLGSITVTNYKHPFTKADEEILDMLADGITAAFLSKDDLIIENSVFETCFRSLLDGKITVSNIKKMGNKELCYTNKTISVALVQNDISYSKRNEISLNYIGRLINSTFHFTKSFLYNGSLVLIHNMTEMRCEHPDELKTRFSDFIKEYHLVMGISNVTDSIDGIKQCYYEAQQALYVLNVLGDKKIRTYEESVASCLLVAASDEIDLKNFISEKVVRLMKYDEEKGTCLYHTLKMYLENMFNLTTTAKALHIHFNTMKKRMQTIKEMGIDIENIEEITSIALSFMIIEHFV